MQKNFYNNKRHVIISSIILMIVALSMMILFLYDFAREINRNQLTVGNERLREVSEISAKFTKFVVTEKMFFMGNVAKHLASREDLKSPETIAYLASLAEGNDFARLAVDFFDGTSYTTDGHIVDISDMGYIERARYGQPFFTDTLVTKIDGVPCISIIVPIKKDGVVVAAARGTIYTHRFSEILNVGFFDGEGYFHLFNSNGGYLSSLNDKNFLLPEQNYYDSIDQFIYATGYSAEKIKDDIKNFRTGNAIYSCNNEERYAQYLPIGIQDWYLTVVTPKWVIDKNSQVIQKSAITLILRTAFVLLLAFLFILYVMRKSRKLISEVNEELLISKQQYRFMLERSNNIIFEYTVKTKSLEYSENFQELFNREATSGVMPQLIIDSKYVHPEDMSSLEAIYQSIQDKKMSLQVEMRIIDRNGVYIWCSVTIATFFDEDKMPVKILGVIENINYKKEQEKKYNDIQTYIKALDSDNIHLVEVNLSQNCYIRGYEEIIATNQISCNNDYTTIQKLLASQYKIIPHFFKNNSIEKLMTEYNTGHTDFEIISDFIKNGKTLWCLHKYIIYLDPKTTDLCAIISVRDVTEQKKKELALLDQAQKDQLTGLYNKTSTENHIKDFLSDSSNVGDHALIIIDIDNFKTINDTLGHLYGDIVLTRLADKLKPIFRKSDIIGRIGGDEFFVFMKNFANPEVVKEKAQEICEAFRNSYSEDEVTCNISASVGIALYPVHGTDFTTLYHNADAALYVAKNQGKNSYSVYDGTQFCAYESTRTEIDLKNSLPQKSFRDNRIEYVFKLLYGSENAVVALHSVLELVSDHFDFSRGFIFETNPDTNTVSNTFEWCAKNIVPQMESLQNIPLTSLVTATEAFDRDGFFIVKKLSDVSVAEKKILEPQGIRSMFLFPIFENNELLLFIGFDDCNKERNLSNIEIDELSTLCNILGTFIIKQRALLNARNNYWSLRTIMDNLDSYSYVIDPKTYKVLFANNKLQKVVSTTKIGGVCYQDFMQRNAPCDYCPLKDLTTEMNTNTLEIYNEKYHIYSRTTASWVDWTDGEKAVLVNSTDITEYKKRL